MVNRLFVAILYVLIVIPAPGLAQRAVGIDWDVPDQPAEAAEDLQYLSDIGISHLQISQTLSPQTWERINRLEFTVWGKLPINFAVTETFSTADSSFASNMQSLAAHYNDQNSVRAIGLFEVGAVHDGQFIEAVNSAKQEFKKHITKPFYYITADLQQTKADSLFEFSFLLSAEGNSNRSFSGYMYLSERNDRWNLAQVKSFIDHTASQPQAPIFFKSSWLKKMVKQHPGFSRILTLYASSAEPAFPLPKKSPTSMDSNTVIVIMLLLAWFSFGAIYSYNPVFRKSFMRYITGHRFFIDDVMQRHVRDIFSGSIILIQHAIAGGIITYCIFNVFFSPLGYQALLSHYPFLSVFGDGILGPFFWGTLLTLLVEIFNILWLWAINPATKFISQIINLYPWLLQINLIVATLVAAFYLAGQRNNFVLILTCVFLIFFISSFILTALDTVRFARKKRHWIYAGTIGIYSVILLATAIWVSFSSELLSVVALAARLP